MSDPNRELCRRQHVVLGQYLAMYAWVKGLDCVVVEREHLERYFQIRHFKEVRLSWLFDDILPWFPCRFVVTRTGGWANAGFATLFLSRKPIEEFLQTGNMTTEDRISTVKKGCPRTAIYRLGKSKTPTRAFPSESAIIGFLSKVAACVESPEIIDRLESAERPSS